MKKIVVVVLDGFGVGEMDDVKGYRPQDSGANTCLHILKEHKDLNLPVLEKLGLMNIMNKELNGMKFSSTSTYGKCKLAHFGADTFFGHQEIMGTKPKIPFTEPIKNNIKNIYNALKDAGYKTNYIRGSKERFLIVEDGVAVADNIECDLGQAFNITAALDIIDFDEVLKIGNIVRNIAKVPRVITFGGEGITLQNILNAAEEKVGGFIGINAPKSGVYNKGYKCVHLGYGVDPKNQIQTILSKNNIPVYLLGKVADIIINTGNVSIPMVDTEDVLKETIRISKNIKSGFICCNVQETDLAGHSESTNKYMEKLIIADKLLEELISTIEKDDLLFIIADHGNDPTIGHAKHTREIVPIMVYGHEIKSGDIGKRETLSDIGATIADYFGVETTENGSSFLDKL